MEKHLVIIKSDLCEVTDRDFETLMHLDSYLCGSFDYWSAKESNDTIKKIKRRAKIVIPEFIYQPSFYNFKLDHKNKVVVSSDQMDDLPF